MNRPLLFVTTLLALTALSGCIGGDDAAAPEDDGLQDRPEDTVVTDTTGSIKGTVASDLFEPLGGATVLVQQLALEATVARNGEFVMNDVEPGSYTLIASTLGYEQAARSVKVVAGEVATLSFLLTLAASDDPFVVAFEEVGSVTLALAWQAEIPTVGCTNVDIAKNCGGVRLGVNSEHAIGSDAEVKTIMAEMVWKPAGPLGETLALDLMCSDVPRGASGAVLEPEHPCFFDTTSQTSPIIHRVDEAHWLEHGYNHTDEWTARIFGTYGATGTYDLTGVDVGVAYEQKFTVYYSVFYKEAAPDGYSGIPDQ